MAASLFSPMPQPPDFTAILEEAFRAEISAAYRPRLITALLIIAACLVAGWLLYRFLQKRRVVLPRHILLIYAIILGGMVVFQCVIIWSAQTVRTAALAEIPDQVKQANGLVHRLLGDATGTAVATDSGTYLALAGDQVFLPEPVADALQKELTAKNLQLPWNGLSFSAPNS
jgi:hypothetical protein